MKLNERARVAAARPHPSFINAGYTCLSRHKVMMK
jgi:hypothetical protein